MNSNAQAQKGFKTFILTLIISLAVFSAIYYIINSGAVENSSREESKGVEVSSEVQEPNQLAAVIEPVKDEKIAVVEQSAEPGKSVFGDLLTQKMDVAPRSVLAVAETGTTVTTTTTPQSTVPVTGMSGPTAGIIISSILLGIASFIIYLGPRKLALSSFEKKVIKDLD